MRDLGSNKLSHPALVSVLAVGAVYFLCMRVLPSFWESNDDPVMAMICSGSGFFSEPDAHIPYMHYALGTLLRVLYQNWHDFPWYTWNLRLAQIAAFSFICFSFLAKRNTVGRLLLFLLFFLSVGLHLLVSIQFTTTAALVGISGFCMLNIWLKKWNTNIGCLICGELLLIWSASLRSLTFELIFVLSLATLVAAFITSKNLRRCLIIFFMLLLAFGASFLLNWTNNNYYQSDGWSDFYRLNSARAYYSDYPEREFPKQTLARILPELHWSVNDLEMIRLFFILDKNVFSSGKIERTITALPPRPFSVSETSTALKTIFEDPILWPTFIIFAFSWKYLDQGSFNRKSLLILSLELLMLIVLLSSRMPLRIYFSVAAYFLAIILTNIDEEKIGVLITTLLRTQKSRFVVLLSVVTVCFGFAQYIDYTCIKPIASRQLSRYSLNQALINLNPSAESLYYTWASCFPFEAISPDENLQMYFKSLNMLPINWLGQSPLVLKQLERFQIKESEICQSLYQKSNVFLISRQSLFNPSLKKYVSEHYHSNIDFTTVLEGSNIAVYRVKKLPSETLLEK